MRDTNQQYPNRDRVQLMKDLVRLQIAHAKWDARKSSIVLRRQWGADECELMTASLQKEIDYLEYEIEKLDTV